MATEVGRLITCDKCHATVFVKYKDTTHLDGGFTRINNFETPPEGWEWFPELVMYLCPECSSRWESFKERFKNE